MNDLQGYISAITSIVSGISALERQLSGREAPASLPSADGKQGEATMSPRERLLRPVDDDIPDIDEAALPGGRSRFYRDYADQSEPNASHDTREQEPSAFSHRELSPDDILTQLFGSYAAHSRIRSYSSSSHYNSSTGQHETIVQQTGDGFSCIQRFITEANGEKRTTAECRDPNTGALLSKDRTDAILVCFACTSPASH